MDKRVPTQDSRFFRGLTMAKKDLKIFLSMINKKY